MIDASGSSAPADRKIHAWILEHPLGVVVFRDGGLGIEEFAIEADRGRNIFDADMHVKSLHGSPIGLELFGHERRARRAEATSDAAVHRCHIAQAPRAPSARHRSR